MMRPAQHRIGMTRAEAAEILGISQSRVSQLAKAGHLVEAGFDPKTGLQLVTKISVMKRKAEDVRTGRPPSSLRKA